MVWGAVAGAVVGGMMNKKSSKGSSSQVSNEPWEGLQPYLTGGDKVVGRWDRPDLNYNAMRWAQDIGAGATTAMAPPQFMTDPRLTGYGIDIPAYTEYNPYGTTMPLRDAISQSVTEALPGDPMDMGIPGGYPMPPSDFGYDPFGSYGGGGPMGWGFSDFETDPYGKPVIKKAPKPKKKKSIRRWGDGSCFIADTMVTMFDGTQKKIQDVKLGDTLKGMDGRANIVIKFDHPKLGNRGLYSINGGTAFVSGEHPFMTNAGWKSFRPDATRDENPNLEVGQLVKGDWLQLEDGNFIELAAFEIDDEADPNTQLYNFTLNGNNTYFADGYLVHNKQGDGPGGVGGGSGSGPSGGSSGGTGAANN